MRIVISGYIGKKITGIGRNLICLLDSSKSDNEYIIYTNYDMKDDMKFSNPNVIVKTYGISKNQSMKNLLWTTFIFPFKVLKEKADKALIPNFSLLLLKFRPTVVIMHDLIEFNVPDKFSKKKMFYRTKLADPITAKRANHIITVSENSKRDIKRFLKVKDSKISVIYNGVDQKKFKQMNTEHARDILKKRGWPTSFLLYAGTIDHPGKNVITIIKAFEKLKDEKKIDEKLILAGMPGKGFETVENYAKQSKYKEDITFTGFVSDEELVALYSCCLVFCFISLYEGFGIPPLEALSCGTKVVVSNTSSLPEVVGKIGSIVQPEDIDGVCEAIIFERNRKSSEEYKLNVKKHLNNYKWPNLSLEFEKAFI